MLSTGQISSMPWRTMLRMPPRRRPGDISWLVKTTGTVTVTRVWPPTRIKSTCSGASVAGWYCTSRGRVRWTTPSTVDVDQRREETAIGERARQFARLQADQHRLLVVAVDDAGDAPRTPRRPGGSLSGSGARFGAQGGDLGHGSSLLNNGGIVSQLKIMAGLDQCQPSGAGSICAAAVLGTQSNRLETDRSSLIRWIASAISGAIVSWRMLCAARTASVATMLSVMTSISIGEAATRGTAPPDSTPWVT